MSPLRWGRHPELAGACRGEEPQDPLGYPKSWRELVGLHTEAGGPQPPPQGCGGQEVDLPLGPEAHLLLASSSEGTACVPAPSRVPWSPRPGGQAEKSKQTCREDGARCTGRRHPACDSAMTFPWGEVPGKTPALRGACGWPSGSRLAGDGTWTSGQMVRGGLPRGRHPFSPSHSALRLSAPFPAEHTSGGMPVFLTVSFPGASHWSLTGVTRESSKEGRAAYEQGVTVRFPAWAQAPKRPGHCVPRVGHREAASGCFFLITDLLSLSLPL